MRPFSMIFKHSKIMVVYENMQILRLLLLCKIQWRVEEGNVFDVDSTFRFDSQSMLSDQEVFP